MTTKTQEIQQLLAAEKKAAETVSESRKRKAKRLRQAKDEAMKEIEVYKAEREATYKALEKSLLGSKTSNEDTILVKTDQKIAEMQLTYEQNKGLVLNDLLGLFFKIEPKTHINLGNH